MLFRISLASLLLAGCTSTSDLRHCDEVIRSQVDKLTSEGFAIIGGGDAVREDGVLLLGQFTNMQTEEGIFAATVDTEPLCVFLKEQDFKQEETCQRGGKEWYTFMKRSKIKLEKN
jgi:hypothetical protein